MKEWKTITPEEITTNPFPPDRKGMDACDR